MKIAVIVTSCLLYLACRTPLLRADCITLKEGGEIRGTLITEAKALPRSPQISMRTLSGAAVTVARDEVEAIVRRRPVIEEYESRRRSAGETIADQWELAEWCRQKALRKEREAHLHRVIELDGEHVGAHRALAHVRHEGRWITPDALMASRGFVRHRGKYVPARDVDLDLAHESAHESEKNWSKRIKQLSSRLAAGPAQRREQAQKELYAIRDPDCLPALARAAASDPDAQHRLMFVEIMARIPGDKPLAALAAQAIRDDAEPVRTLAIEAIGRKDAKSAIPLCLRALKSSQNAIVNRSAAVLGSLGEESVVPQLIEALVTRHEYSVEVPNPDPLFCNAGLGDPANVVMPPGLALNLMSSGLMPLVAQNQPKPVRAQTPDKEMMTITFQRDEENPEVHSALSRLTEYDFGFDQAAWKKWHNGRRAGRIRGTN
ncbi:MAG TPA: HEAT repeat domain-containing protein [Planctomycetaceae bacterium]|nr:HEAT repeat domain-containing protein [Planctomycetaceae bacterium]